ncbi:MAG: glycosyltransferase [Phycisphaerae bacterium]
MPGSLPSMVSGLQSTPYVLERTHTLLADRAWSGDGPNIGKRGCNLTILLLSLNRSSLTVNLLRSIHEHMPKFAGKLLIVDNGSAEEERAILREACAKLPFEARVLEMDRNYGVAGGRNRGFAAVTTDWVMCLDNDMYFLSDPLDQIQRDIAILGCHFLNLPLLDCDAKTIFALGGHIYVSVDHGVIRVGAGSVFPQAASDGRVNKPFLSTFLFGGASIINRRTFDYVGGFDEGMFIGFEDIDFSIRLHQAGLKVGNTACVAIVHDHPPATNESDQDYERKRFARETLKRSADYLEAKHGMIIWSTVVDDWLKQRQRELGVDDVEIDSKASCVEVDAPAAKLAAAPRSKPKIALITDVEGWAFSNIARQVCRYLGDRYEFRTITTNVVDNIAHVFLMARDCDVIHVFWRETLRMIDAPHVRDYVQWTGGDFDRLLRQLRGRVISTCVYEHLYLTESELAERRPFFNEWVDFYYTGSQRLRQIYEAVPDFRRPSAVLEDGVDLTLFLPRNASRFDTIGEREVVLGWAGNSKWSGQDVDFKGVRTILIPAIEQLRAEGLAVRLEMADASVARREHREMLDYYSTIDAYVCTSLIEGTPNPVLESMACGVPIVTTDVGVIPEAFGDKQKQFVLGERSIDCLKSMIRKLIERPANFRELSEENLHSIRAWDWSVKTRGFDEYFQKCLAKKCRVASSE